MESEPSDLRPVAGGRRRTGRATLAAIAVWASAGAASALFTFAYSNPFLPLDRLARGLWTFVGVGLLARCVWLARVRRGRSASIAAGGLVALMLALSPIFWPALASAGAWAGVRLDFARNRGLYEAVVARLAEGPVTISGRAEVLGVSCLVEPGPPLRVAFPLPGGLLDNWTAIVYDPSEEVRRMERVGPDLSGWDDPDLRELRGWFGGGMRHARRLGGGFFYCVFTQPASRRRTGRLGGRSPARNPRRPRTAGPRPAP